MQYPALSHFVESTQDSSTIVNFEETTVTGTDDVHCILNVTPLICLICIVVPQSSKPGFRDSE